MGTVLAAFNGDKFLAQEFLALKDKHGIVAVIETGTYMGQTTAWLGENFEMVMTSEINEGYYRKAQKALKPYTNVQQYLGDSVKAIEELLTPLQVPTLTFLDAHWYKNPLLGELKAIAASGRKPVIVIHDFQVPGHPEFGFDSYPDQGITYNWEWIESHVKEIFGEAFTYRYNTQAEGAMRGVVIIEPA